MVTQEHKMVLCEDPLYLVVPLHVDDRLLLTLYGLMYIGPLSYYSAAKILSAINCQEPYYRSTTTGSRPTYEDLSEAILRGHQSEVLQKRRSNKRKVMVSPMYVPTTYVYSELVPMSKIFDEH